MDHCQSMRTFHVCLKISPTQDCVRCLLLAGTPGAFGRRCAAGNGRRDALAAAKLEAR